MSSTIRKLGLIWLAWTAAGLFYATQEFTTRLYRSETIPWVPVVAGWMVSMYICAAFTPLLLWLGRRWPLEGEHRVQHVLLHLIFGAIFSVLSAAIEAPLLLALKFFPDPTRSASLLSATALLLAYGFHGGMIRYWAVIGLQSLFRSHQAAREREREALQLSVRSSKLAQRLSAAQLSALKMQLQPHFLFNTLGAIMVLTQHNEGRQASAMLERLSDLLRLTLEDVDAQEVALERELQFLRLYLSIEQIRFADRLRVRITADVSLSDALVPHMLLQPIVENAIRHGLGRSEEPVLIDIHATRNGDQLSIAVSDDGPGSLSPSFEGTGIGLANIRGRLKHLYGTKAELQAENRSPRGARVAVTLPFHVEPTEPSDALEDSGRR